MESGRLVQLGIHNRSACYSDKFKTSAGKVRSSCTSPFKAVKPEQLLVEPRCWATLDYQTITSPHAKGKVSWTGHSQNMTLLKNEALSFVTTSKSGFGVRGSGFGVLTFGVRSSGFGVRSSGFGVRSSGFGVRGSGFGVRDSGFSRSHVLTFGVRSSGFGVRDSGFSRSHVLTFSRSGFSRSGY